MKKLVITAALAIMAVAVNAASVDWEIGKKAFKLADGTTKPDAKAVYIITAAAAADWSNITTALGNGTLTEANLSTKLADYNGTYVGSGTTKASPTAQNYGSATGTGTIGSVGLKQYAVLVFDSVSTDNYYLLSGTGAGTSYISDPGEGSPAVFSSEDFGSWVKVSSTPEPTPEPTSGLLLLLGVAGLALKRKHA